ncbi:hypothetical protein KVR01_007760 [Diaporthe batatas]|uniref:uncharacterized protein n=1 Tax=Diaporthe batatas TaxID=748121 RepID=UPI001D037E3E|nr:uncharacterized protein KVR01_007760 [Diaporthe batatas]KAG8161995.1 hypothetical protein KVR01_007760 [Diaporthe batatas]
MADALSGLYPPAGLILGGVFMALSVTKRVVKYQEALLQFLMKATSTLGQLSKFRTAFPDSTEIQTGLVDIFDIILQTCVQASTLFFDEKGKDTSTSRLFWKSFDKDFGAWQQSLDTSLETFDRTVQLVSGQRLGDLHGGQMMALRVQLETYRAVRRSETERLQEETNRQARLLQQKQDEKRIKLLAWLSPLSFQTTHNSILATTLDETGLWVLQHENYVSWKKKSRDALLWIYGKHGSGKSHLAARVIEELRAVCHEKNAASGNSDEKYFAERSMIPSIREIEENITTWSTEDESAQVAWQEGAGPTNSPDNSAWNSLDEAASHKYATSKVQSASERTALAYIYCSYQQVQSSERWKTGRSTEPADLYDSTGLLSCILKQLYQFLPKAMDVSELEHACFGTGEDLPSREAITNGIRDIIPMFSQSFIVVDGLDECSGMSGLEFETFCTFLVSLTSLNLSGTSANVLMFSRPGYPAITNAINDCPSIEVDKGANTKDISRFIDDRSVNLTSDSASLKEIQGSLLYSADGMFLWVSLVIDSIKQERTAKKMKAAARNMPRGLHGAYTDAMRRIMSAEPSIKDLALKALLWATNSKRPLSKAQLLEALAIEEGMTSIGEDEKLDHNVPLTKDCADLLVLKDGNYTLVHPSLGDFLRGLCNDSVEELAGFRDLQTNAAHILGVDCLTYLNFRIFAEGPMSTEDALKETLQRHPFLEYAAVFWGDHIREALEQRNSSLEDRICELLEPPARRDLIHQVYMRFSSRRDEIVSIFPFPSGTSPLHILSIFGLHQLLWRYPITELDINKADGFGNCLLDYASQNGHQAMSSRIVEEHVRRIHDASQVIDRQCKSKSWLVGTIIRHHWTDLMIILLELGHSTSQHGASHAPTALHLASNYGYTDMMERLLLSGADSDARDHNGKTPLMIAARANHLGATQMLLDHGADVRYCDYEGFTPLHLVAGVLNGKKELAAVLLDRGARIEAKTQEGATPLHRAAAFGSESMISFLLDRGANQYAATRELKGTPLLVAVKRERRDAVRLLLSRGASIPVQTLNHFGSTALHDAAALDSLETISQLLSIDAGKTVLDWRDDVGFTALSAAASKGAIDSAKRLLDEGADVESANNLGMTPLLIALNNGHTSLAQILVDVYKANPHHIDHRGWNAMHHSALSGGTEDARILLSWGVEAFTQNKNRRTPLHHAVASNNTQFVKYYIRSFSPENVLMRQKDSEPLGADGYTPLHYAVERKDSKMVRCLLEYGADADGLKSTVPSPLIKALKEEQYEIANILLDWKANADAKDEENWRPLHFATSAGHQQLTRRLMDAGCELEPQNDEGDTPLFVACFNVYPEIIELFFDRGIKDITIQCSGGLTYAHVAAYRGLHSVLERLVKMSTKLVSQTTWNGLDPLCLAASGQEPETVELLLASGVRPDGPYYTQRTPLGLAATRGALKIVESLLTAGARVDKMGPLLRTPLMLAVWHGHARVAYRLLQAGANPFLQDELGLSAFDLAAGRPAMRAILDPWSKRIGGFLGDNLPQDGYQIHALLQFISRTARAIARNIEQGAPARVRNSFWLLEISSDYFFALTDALLLLIRFQQAGRVPKPEFLRITRGPMGSCVQVLFGDNFRSVPTKKNGIYREYRVLLSDSDGSATCDFCFAELRLDYYYVCCICPDNFACPPCQRAITVLSLEERSKDFGLLGRLRDEVFAVRRALRPIRYQGPGAMKRIISHGPWLKDWIFQKAEDYQKWRGSREAYRHFQPANITGWRIVDTMKSILSQSAGPADVTSDTEDTEDAQSKRLMTEWHQLTEEWLDIFERDSDGLAEDIGDFCDHPYQMYLAKRPRRLDGDAALDSSGKLTAKFLHFLADKYEEAMDVGPDVMDFLESKSFDHEGSEDSVAQEWFRDTETREGSTQLEETAERRSGTRSQADYTSESSSSDETSSETSETLLQTRREDGDMVGNLEEFLDSLLAKRNSLVEFGRLTEEEDLILNTAWNMAQAIVYQSTPRPSLKEISSKDQDYCSASTTALQSDRGGYGDNEPSSYGTPRSMSPVAWS